MVYVCTVSNMKNPDESTFVYTYSIDLHCLLVLQMVLHIRNLFSLWSLWAQNFDIPTSGAHHAVSMIPYMPYEQLILPKWLLYLLSILSLVGSGGICLLCCFLAFALCTQDHPTHQNKP